MYRCVCVCVCVYVCNSHLEGGGDCDTSHVPPLRHKLGFKPKTFL